MWPPNPLDHLVADPHRRVRAIIRANQRAEMGWSARMVQACAPLVLAVVLIPWIRPVFLHFLEAEDPSSEGLFGILIRMGIVLIGWGAIGTYGVLVRSPEREVLAILPVDAGRVALEACDDWMSRRAWVPLAAATWLVPVGLVRGWDTWLACALALVGAFLVGTWVSAGVHMRAVLAAQDPALEGWLDLVRGANPREQAAFLWAPGVALALSALPAGLAMEGVRRFAEGSPAALVALVLPMVVALWARSRLCTWAAHSWYAASSILTDIDARYAEIEQEEDASAVYMDWAIRGLPSAVRRYALKDLRHGWRGRRSWLTATWGVAVLCALALWRRGGMDTGEGAMLLLGGAWMLGSVGVVMERDEPGFLRAWLPEDRRPRVMARACAVGLWLQPLVWLPVAAGLVRHGAEAAAWLVLWAGVAALAVSLVSGRASLGRERGLWAYVPLATLCALGQGSILLGGSTWL